MPKMKTHSASKKRFKKRKNDITFSAAFKRHLLTKKTTKRKRKLRKTQSVNSCDMSRVARLLPN